MPKGRGFFAGSQIASKPPPRTLSQCGACGLHKRCNSPKMQPTGKGRRKVLFVAGAPTDDDDDAGEQFTGNDGKRLRRVLQAIKFDLDTDGWKTNAVVCCTPNNRKPTNAEVQACRPNLNKAIREFKPHVIVPMGGKAVDAVVGPLWKDNIEERDMPKWAGWQVPSQKLNAWVCPTWHPGYVISEEDKVIERQFKEHLRAATAFQGYPWPDGPPKWADSVRRELDAGKAARWLRKAATMQTGAIAWDYETNMLKPDGPDARIHSCSVAWGRREPERCIAFPWHGEAIVAMGELLQSPVPKIASNLKFEQRWTKMAFGCRVHRWAWDTMVAGHVCDNRTGTTSVKFQALVRLGVPVWNDKIKPFLTTKGNMKVNRILEEIDIMDLLLYNGLDSIYEFRVAVDQLNELDYPLPWAV